MVLNKIAVLLSCVLFPFLLGHLEAKVWIQEFMASNKGEVVDEDGDKSDWIEIYNDGDVAVDLSGWSLTDNDADLRKWVFPPGVMLEGDDRILVFASGKNRRLSGAELHTNFSLSKAGEYLALVRDDGTMVEHQFNPYPQQFNNVSYGRGRKGTVSVVVDQGSSAQAGVPVSEADFTSAFTGWNDLPANPFLGSGWRNVTAGVGYDRDASNDYGEWIGANGDFETEMWEKNSSIFLRVPFEISDSSKVTRLRLAMRYDDGFVAYLNGEKIATSNEPQNLTWDASALASRPDASNDELEFYEIKRSAVTLVSGTNILAFHGLNAGTRSSDMLVLPSLEVEIGDDVDAEVGFMVSATPRTFNSDVTTVVAPLIDETTRTVARPTGGASSEPLLISARIRQGTNAIGNVLLHYRVMFDAEVTLAMSDSGVGGDSVAGDGVFTASMPTEMLNPGEMIRWRIEATDVNDSSRTAPAFADSLDSDEYYGTVALNGEAENSNLPVLETFVEDQSSVDTQLGTRVSIYFLDRFYDNIRMDVHGQSSLRFPKKSYDLDFNRGNRFVWKEGETKVKDINLLSNWADKSKVRNTVAYEMFKRAGVGYHYAFPVRVERNGEFFSVADMVEDGDDRYLDRLGLDSNGALYKMYDRLETIDGGIKQTRRDDDKSDLQVLIDGVARSNSNSERRRFCYDQLDVAAVINYMAAYQTGGTTDVGHKNYYLYRDTEGNEEWRFLPWDVDLSLGREFVGSRGGYFDDTLYPEFLVSGDGNPIFQLVHNVGEFKEMFLRRSATLKEELMQASGGGDWIGDEVARIRDQIGADAELDYLKWGSWGNQNRMQEATQRIFDEFLVGRRNFMNSSRFGISGTSAPEYANPTSGVTISSVEAMASGQSGEAEYFTIKNSLGSAVDISGWTITGAVEHTFPAGTVIPMGGGTAESQYRGLLYVTRDAKAFRARTEGPKGGEFRFVQDGYKGRLSARGETLELRDRFGVFIDSFSYPSAPTDAQLALRVTELNYHPLPPTFAEQQALPGIVAEDFEFVELQNIGSTSIQLEGTSFTSGISFTFTESLMLGPDEFVIVAKNPDAFRVRYPNSSAPMFGPYLGVLSNDGEEIGIADGFGENVVQFTYNDRWYPLSDGAGKSLVLRDTTTDVYRFDSAMVWAAGATDAGTPGSPYVSFFEHYNAWQEERFTEAERSTVGALMADPDGDGNMNWIEYAYGLDPAKTDDYEVNQLIVTEGGERYFAVTTRRRTRAGDIEWLFETGDTLDFWQVQDEQLVSQIENADGTSELVLRDNSPIGKGRGFFRLKAVYKP